MKHPHIIIRQERTNIPFTPLDPYQNAYLNGVQHVGKVILYVHVYNCHVLQEDTSTARISTIGSLSPSPEGGERSFLQASDDPGLPCYHPPSEANRNQRETRRPPYPHILYIPSCSQQSDSISQEIPERVFSGVVHCV